MRECRCQEYTPTADPRHDGMCLRCLGHLRDEWTSNDETVAEFFDRLEESLFPHAVLREIGPPEWFRAFRSHCEAREDAGRDSFGHRHVNRDNTVDGMEEAADGALYSFFDVLAARRLNEDDEIDVALTAAHHFALAHRHLAQLHSAAPTPISETTS